MPQDEPKDDDESDAVIDGRTPTPAAPLKSEEVAALEAEKKALKAELAKLEDAPGVDYYGEALSQMGIPDLEKLRERMRKFTLPFGIREKEQRIGEDDPSHKYKFKTQRGVDIGNVQKQIEKIKEGREKARKEK